MSAKPALLDPAILDELNGNLSAEELEILLDEDETKLEEREAALRGITLSLAEQSVKSNVERDKFEELRDRYDAIERNVKALRRKRSRTCINCLLTGGRVPTRIFDLEKVDA